MSLEPLKPGQIRFHQWCKPPLDPGDYKLEVTQTVDELKRRAPFKGELSFSVAGPRFSLNPADIYCVYPPNGEFGDFANSLPHVVFTRRTLPWERNLHPGADPASDKPWMAILSFSMADFADYKFPEIKVRRIKEVLQPETNIVGPQKIQLQSHESDEDLCNTIDIPGVLFRQIAPRLADLGYLAHVREVDTGDKETLSFLADGWFSVVLGNRFPEPEKPTSDGPLAVENRACLVSLEGMENSLLGGSEDLAGKSVRLAVLASWNFHCRHAYSFKASMEKLTTDGFKLPLPREWPNNQALSEAQKYVSDGFNRGYVALNHQTRSGEKTASWYRGPLTPVMIEKKNYKFRPVPDGLLRYDNNNGLMDVTYATATQLGRLLGLQDRHFAKALCAYRAKVQSQIRAYYRKDELLRALNAGATCDDKTESQLLEFGLNAALSNKSSRATNSNAKNENDLLKTGLKNDAIERNPPQTVRRWLARLMLLYRVPFTYLVPDERLLPPDSLRFFCIDPGWIKCLIEGACSVGRSSTEEQLVDEYLRNRFLNFDVEQCPLVRQRTESAHEASGKPNEVKVNWPLTGFLLRSALVAGWQGLEMRAWQSWNESEKKGRPLAPLRIDRLAPEIMICIFNGSVVRIEIKQPPEGMHFGATPVRNGPNYIKTTLRRLSPAQQAGDQVVSEKSLRIPMRRSSSEYKGTKRVVEVAKLANKLQKSLKLQKDKFPIFDMDPEGKRSQQPTSVPAMDVKSEFTSAELGVQMTESPGMVFINIPSRPKVDGVFQGYPAR
jgi:hypothetical protein